MQQSAADARGKRSNVNEPLGCEFTSRCVIFLIAKVFVQKVSKVLLFFASALKFCHFFLFRCHFRFLRKLDESIFQEYFVNHFFNFSQILVKALKSIFESFWVLKAGLSPIIFKIGMNWCPIEFLLCNNKATSVTKWCQHYLARNCNFWITKFPLNY